MHNINIFIKEFTQEVRRGSDLRVTSEGEFYVNNTFVSVVKKVLGLHHRNWVKVSKEFRHVLRDLESLPVYLNISNSYANQVVNFQDFLNAGYALLDKLESVDSEYVKNEFALLKRELIALVYRIEDRSPKSFASEDFASLAEAARSWKSSQVIFHDSTLSSDDINILQEACQYSDFIELILESSSLREKFFEWTLRDQLPVRPFIEYPAAQQKIVDCGLNGRIGRVEGNHLKVQVVEDSEGLYQKVLTLPFEGKDVNILDDSRFVSFRGNYSLKIKEIFEVFANKRFGLTNLEFMGEGIINWNAFKWGWWDEDIQDFHLVDFSQSEWWKQLPIFEILSLREAREKFGNHLDGRQWNVAATAARERANLDFEGAHAYSSIAIPIGQGRYAVYTFGKYAVWFPKTLLEAFRSIGQTSEATIVYPDENVYYMNRQKSRYSFALSEEQGHVFMNSIKQDMILSRAKNLVYQIESENCAKWAHKKIEEIVGPHRIPNVFQMPFLRSEPNGFMIKVFDMIHSLPQKWRVPVTLCIHFFLGGYKGLWIWEEGKRVWKSLTYHPFWEDTVIYHPSMLHKQQELGIIGRSVSQGVTFCKSHIHHSFHDLHHKIVVFGEYILTKSLEGLIRFLASIGDLLSSHEEEVEENLPLSEHLSHESQNEASEQQPQNSRLPIASVGMESALTKGL